MARGTRNSPWACSPLTLSGPAKPMGTWATPVKFSMLPLVDRGIEGELVDVLQLDPRVLLDELLAGLDDLRGVVVVLVEGDRRALDLHGDGVLYLEGEGAERGRLEPSATSCWPLSSCSMRAWMFTTLASGKAMAEVGADAAAGDAVAVQLQAETVERHRLAVDPHLVSRVKVALLRRFLRLNRTPSSTF